MSTRDFSSKQEERIARRFGGKVQSNSGGTRFGGGDVHTRTFFIEAKTPTTEKKAFSIKKDWMDKLRQQSFEQCKNHGALAFCFEPRGPNYYVISESDMAILVDFCDNIEGRV